MQKLCQHPSFIDFSKVLITFEFVIIHAQPRGHMSQFPNKKNRVCHLLIHVISTGFRIFALPLDRCIVLIDHSKYLVSDPVILSYYTYKCSSFTGSTWLNAHIPVNSCFRIHVHSVNPCFLLVPKVGNIRNIFPFRELEIHIGLFTSDQAVNIPF